MLGAPATWAAGVVRSLPWARRGAGELIGPRRQAGLGHQHSGDIAELEALVAAEGDKKPTETSSLVAPGASAVE